GRQGVFLERGESLKVTVEVHPGGGFIAAFTAVGGDLGLDVVDPERLLAGIVDGNIDRHHDHVLVRNFDGSDIVHRAPALGLGARDEGVDAEQDGGNAQDDSNDLSRWKIALRGTKFLSNIDSWTGTEIHRRSGLRFWAWLRSGSGRRVRRDVFRHGRPRQR